MIKLKAPLHNVSKIGLITYCSQEVNKHLFIWNEVAWHKKNIMPQNFPNKDACQNKRRRMIFVNKIATPDLSLHRFFFNKCTHKWHQIVIPFFPCDGFQQKRGLFYSMLPWYSLRQQSIVWRSVRSSWPLTLFILHLTHYSWLCL